MEVSRHPNFMNPFEFVKSFYNQSFPKRIGTLTPPNPWFLDMLKQAGLNRVNANYKDCELNSGPETLGRPFLINLMDKRTEIMKLAYVRTGFTVRQYFYISQQEPDEPKIFENFCQFVLVHFLFQYLFVRFYKTGAIPPIMFSFPEYPRVLPPHSAPLFSSSKPLYGIYNISIYNIYEILVPPYSHQLRQQLSSSPQLKKIHLRFNNHLHLNSRKYF